MAPDSRCAESDGGFDHNRKTLPQFAPVSIAQIFVAELERVGGATNWIWVRGLSPESMTPATLSASSGVSMLRS